MSRRRSLRHRLTAAFVIMSIAVLVVAGLLTAILARATALSEAESELQRNASSLADVARTITQRERSLGRDYSLLTNLEVLCRVTPELDANVGFVVLRVDGRFETTEREIQRCPREFSADLPPGVTREDLDVTRLRADETIVGRHRRLVYVAKPLLDRDGRLPVIVLARDVGTTELGGRLGRILLLAGVIATALAIIGSTVVARRVSQPIQTIERAALAIGRGDLSTRVGHIADANAELESLASTIDHMAAELERSRGAERSFLMSVSHDLRTPLTSIRGYAEAIAEGTADDEETRVHAAGIIGAEARRLERLVRDLLDLARLDAHQFTLRPSVADPVQIVVDAAAGFRPMAEGMGLTIEAIAGPTRLSMIDPERLGQVVANLTENAVKYATNSVTVHAIVEGAMLQVTVDDDGPGIAEADRSRVFERLYTSRGLAGRAVGTGLGLAIVAELVDLMAGTVAVDETASGTRFVVRLVLATDPSTPS